MNWFAENIGTVVVTIILIAVVALVVRKMISDKRKGKSSCGNTCASCPMSGSCHRH